MDTLVALGSGAAFAWSSWELFRMTAAGSAAEQMEIMHEGFYFEAAAMILTLITVGKMLEARSKGRTTDALKGLMRLAPRPPPSCAAAQRPRCRWRRCAPATSLWSARARAYPWTAWSLRARAP